MSSRDTKLYRQDAAASGTLLNVEEREALLRKYLPAREDDDDDDDDGIDEDTVKSGPTGSSTATAAGTAAATSTTTTTASSSSRPSMRKTRRRKPIRSFLKTQLYFIVFAIVQLVFGIYIRARRTWRAIKALMLRVLYHHHRTPELIANDVAGLSRLPKHLSVILELPVEDQAAPGSGAVGGIGSSSSGSSSSRRALRRKIRNSRKRRSKLLGSGRNVDKDATQGLLLFPGQNQVLSLELEALLDDIAELAAWSAAAGIPVLSIYERRGVLKEMIPDVHAAVRARIGDYFGEKRAPSLQVRAPHVASYLNGDEEDVDAGQNRSPEHSSSSGGGGGVASGDEAVAEKHFEYDSPLTSGGEEQEGGDADREAKQPRGHLNLLLLSEDDGRATMVDLTKTLTEMSQKGKLSLRDVGLELIEQELSESYSAGDPDLLMLFGDRIVLQGYPPWQLRLTEIFCAGDGNGGSVDYPTWLKGLYRFAKAEMRLGR